MKAACKYTQIINALEVFSAYAKVIKGTTLSAYAGGQNCTRYSDKVGTKTFLAILLVLWHGDLSDEVKQTATRKPCSAKFGMDSIRVSSVISARQSSHRQLENFFSV